MCAASASSGRLYEKELQGATSKEALPQPLLQSSEIEPLQVTLQIITIYFTDYQLPNFTPNTFYRVNFIKQRKQITWTLIQQQ